MDKKILFVVIYITLLLGGFWMYAALPSRAQTVVQLRLHPVDPTDLFAGEYMTLLYDISEINTSLSDAPFEPGEAVYVQLSQDTPAQAIRFTHNEPEGIFLKGEMTDPTHAEYGIERFYIPEGSGERTINLTWTAQIRVSPSGRGMVEKLLEQGNPVDFTYSGPNAREP